MQQTDLLAIQIIARKEAARAVKNAADTSLKAMAITIKGEDGKDSVVPGPKGDKGDAGPQGPQGQQGPRGDTGPKGNDSTVPGPQGTQGNPGARGNDGRDGVSIRDVYVDPDDGDLYVELTNSRLINAGHVKGQDGKPGKDGKTVFVGGGGSVSSGGTGGTVTSGPGIVIVGSEVRMSIGTLPLAG